ncbi:hypothetical protein ILUMI_07613 [Ignelater luminosus]|uniref:Zinc finger protein on ecdysone puffs n=1 Tax=Ignelater luminosus TaxID=2038154 RepID=A0A8K0D380_IGNLU|nr:hypothetical protein ILUMI_07613 [Ignelater luminosus]
MSYYRPSFSQTVAMTRGRGFSSSYRGNSGGRSSWGAPSDRGRGTYGSSRGSGGGGGAGGGRFSSSFSNSLDSRSKYPPSSSDRYSGTRSDYDDYHHKSYRSDIPGGSSYSGRDHRSPDRKRLRAEAPSSRRSHEADNFNSSSSSRYQSNSFSDRSFSRDRRPSFSSRRDDFRKPSGPPPSSSPRGGYRGRISSRGVRGARLREGLRRRLVESSYAIRRRVASRVSGDYSRRLKMSRLRSAIARRTALKRRQPSDKDDSDEKGKVSDNEEKKDKEKAETDTEEGGEKKEKDSKKSPKKDATSDKEDKGNESDRDDKSRRKEFIKLVCPHCNTKCVTFSKYSLHLHSSRHMTAMRHVAMKQKSVLARMRLSQRNAQRELEKTTDDLAPRTNFCPLCKLNYKQPKATHQASDSHKSMKKFLMPYCRVCRITFKSPMLYETHICSIEHIKRKSRVDMNGEKSDKDDGSGNDEELENFMTIDSVGDVDDEDDGKKKDIEGKPKEQINVGIEQIRKVEVHYCELCRMYLPRVEENELEKTLSKHCKQRTHMQRYIRYKEDKEIANRAERLQRKETAEKEREKSKVKEEEKGSDNEVKKSEDIKTEEKEKTNGADDEENADDKLWADDVNKDIGDLLAEAESGNKSSDEDEDSHADGERYDRFRYSEKNGEDKKVEDEGKEGTAENKPDADKAEDK